jgi:hypothetical protein
MTIQRPIFPPPQPRAEEPSTHPTSATRRSIIVAAPALAAAALAMGGISNTLAIGKARTEHVDPVFEAIEAHRTLRAELRRLTDALNEARHAAEKEHGARPPALIEWRNHAAIGGAEIDRARLEYLRGFRVNSKVINWEYRRAKVRYVAAVRAGAAWDERAGVAPLHEQFKRAKAAERDAAEHLAVTRPTTAAGAGAFIAYVTEDIGADAGFDWHFVAFNTVSKALTTFKETRA